MLKINDNESIVTEIYNYEDNCYVVSLDHHKNTDARVWEQSDSFAAGKNNSNNNNLSEQENKKRGYEYIYFHGSLGTWLMNNSKARGRRRDAVLWDIIHGCKIKGAAAAVREASSSSFYSFFFFTSFSSSKFKACTWPQRCYI